MAKNKQLLDRYKLLYKKIQQITPEVYAAIALSLYRDYKWDPDLIEELFTNSQLTWEACLEEDINMIDLCLRETGIELRAERSS